MISSKTKLNLGFVFCFVVTTKDAHGFPLALCSRFTPGRALQTICGAFRAQTGVGPVQGRCLPYPQYSLRPPKLPLGEKNNVTLLGEEENHFLTVKMKTDKRQILLMQRASKKKSRT